MYIGCNDGTLLELNCKTFKIEREMENRLPIQSIVVLENDLVISAHSIKSGYMEARSALQIVKPGPLYKFVSLENQSLSGTGDINQIIVNAIDETELILAC